MYYGKVVTATAGTSESSPETSILVVNAGILHHVIVQIPAGHAGVTHLAFDIGKHQIIPESPDMTLQGNGVLLDLKEHIPLKRFNNRIRLRYWNTSTVNDHTFYVLVGVLEEEYLGLELNMKNLVDRIDKLIWRLGG